jgi:hypothetical protein
MKGTNVKTGDVNVTQNLALRIVPVNMPNKTNRWGERLGFYRAYVSHTDRNFAIAEHEARRGIISELVGYGSGGTPQEAAKNAIVDYAAKFGPLCIVNGQESA